MCLIIRPCLLIWPHESTITITSSREIIYLFIKTRILTNFSRQVYKSEFNTIYLNISTTFGTLMQLIFIFQIY